MAVGAQQYLDARPVVTQGRDQAAQPEQDLSHGRSASGAQQGAPVRQVLGARHGGLRTQLAVFGQPVHRQLEQRVGSQGVGVVAILVAGGDHQHAEPDDLIEPVQAALGRARVTNTIGETPGDPQPLLDLPQQQQTTIGGHQRAVEARLDHRSADRSQAGQNGGSVVADGHGASRSMRIGRDNRILHQIDGLRSRPPTLMHFCG